MKEFFKKYKTIITYVSCSFLSFIVDLLAFSIILFFIKNKFASAILISSYLARIISSIFNYIVNKKYVFKYNNKDKDNSWIGYFILVIINITISGTLVSKIYNILHFNATILKAMVDGIIFIINYFLQKKIIFNNNSKSISKYILPIISFIALFVKMNDKGIVFSYKIYEIIIMVISLPLLYLLYLKVFKYNNIKFINILSIIFTIFMIVGYSYYISYTPKLIYASDIHILITIIKWFGFYYLIKNVLYLIYKFIIEYKYKDINNKIILKFSKHPFWYSVIILSIVYGFYLIFYYPGVINYDNANQIKEVLGLHTRYLDSIIVLDKNVTLTNFNPIVHTLLLGNFFKLGLSMGSANLGILFYTLFQEIIVILILAYSIYFLYKENIKPQVLFIVLLIYAIIPFFPYYALTAVKDTLFYVFTMLYIIKLYQFIKYDFKIMDYLVFLGIMFLIILFRNNGIVIILASLPFCALLKGKFVKKSLLLTSIVLIFLVTYNGLLPVFNIPNTSIREGLSIPFQQTARYVKDYGKDVLKDEEEVIDKILEYDTLASRYQEELSDKVKNKFNKYATKDDIKNYFKVWGKMFFKHPDAYINATISNNFGYFYPSDYNWYVYTNLNRKLKEAGYDYHFNNLESGRNILKGYSGSFMYIPVLNLTVSCGFYTWVYMFLGVLLIVMKKKKLIILLAPAFSMIFMCFIGPANTYFRYVLPYAATLPLIMCLLIKEINPYILNNKND